MAEIKKVGVINVRPLNADEAVSCEHCGETETKMVQSYTRKVTCRDDEDLKVLHYIDSEACVNCGDNANLVIWNNATDKEVDSEIYVYTDLTNQPSREKFEAALKAIVDHPEAKKMFDWAFCGIAANSTAGTPGREMRMESYNAFKKDFDAGKELVSDENPQNKNDAT